MMEGKRYNKEYAKKWTSHKYNGPGVRYEVGLGILSGDIVWVNGPFPCGIWPDLKIMKEGGILELLEENERIETDDGYRGLDPEFCLTKSGLRHPSSDPGMRARVRARQETVNKRFRQFAAASNVYRHDVLNHSKVFYSIVVLTQLAIESGEPLFHCHSYEG